MANSRIIERLGLPAAALTFAATAQATQAVASTLVGTAAKSNIIDAQARGDHRMLVRAGLIPVATTATGNATVAIYHGTATNAMSAASKGTGTTPMQATAAIGTAGGIVELELAGADLIGKNRYLQAVVIPGGSLAAAVAVTIDVEPRHLTPTSDNVSSLATPVVVADL